MEQTKDMNEENLKEQKWHIWLCLPTIASYYIVWYCYTYLILWIMLLISEKHRAKLLHHEKTMPICIIAMSIAIVCWNLFPHNSIMNISQYHLSRFVSWIYFSCAEEVASIKWF